MEDIAVDILEEGGDESPILLIGDISTSNHMALRVIWDKCPELFYKIVKSPERSEGDLIL